MSTTTEYITYHFFYNTSDHFQYRLGFSPENWQIVEPRADSYDDWVNLEFKQCKHCPLDNHEKHCPLAKQLFHLNLQLPNFNSNLETDIRIDTSVRSYEKKTSLAQGMKSLLGLIFASSNCPHLFFFQPMARFHLPFATEEENMYRVFASFALFNVMSKTTGLMYKLSDLKDIYENLQIINNAMCERITAVSKTDSTVNAVLLLDSMSRSMVGSIDGVFNEIQSYFAKISEDGSHPKNEQV